MRELASLVPTAHNDVTLIHLEATYEASAICQGL